MFAVHMEAHSVYPPLTETVVDEGEKLRERLAEVCTICGWTEREWAAKAGVSHSSLSAFRRRLATDPTASMNRNTLRALAETARVRVAWLARGEGEREAEDTTTAYALPNATTTKVSDATPVARIGGPLLSLASLARWTELESQARRLRPFHPAWVWDRVASVPLFLRVEPSAEVVAALADIVRWTEESVSQTTDGGA